MALLSDKIAQYFVALILVCASCSAFYWLQHEPDEAFWITLSILVATCPCALALATPTALTCATTRLNKAGIMIKSAHVLETLPEINCFAFDKTGTLTNGQFALSHIVIIDKKFSEDQILSLAAGLESSSEHPIAKAFAPYRNNTINFESIQVVSGQGVQGIISNAHAINNIDSYAIGKINWLLSSTTDNLNM